MGLKKTKCTPDCDYENDNVERVAHVYIVTNRILFSHWSVVFVYNDCYITVEGLPDGLPGVKLLKPKYTKTRTRPDGIYYTFREMSYFIDLNHLDFMLSPIKHELIGLIPLQMEKVRMSPQEIYKECMNNVYNDTLYVFGVIDCQVWALGFAMQLKKYQERE